MILAGTAWRRSKVASGILLIRGGRTLIATTPTEPTPPAPPPELELSEGVKRIINRTPEQKLADREAAMKYVRKGRPLPPGKTLDDVMCGFWPGDETDEEVNRALEELS